MKNKNYHNVFKVCYRVIKSILMRKITQILYFSVITLNQMFKNVIKIILWLGVFKLSYDTNYIFN